VSYTPLASYADLSAGPLVAITSSFTGGEQTNLMTRASRALEVQAGRRLAQFSGLVETHTLQALDIDDAEVGAYVPLPESAVMGISRAQSLGISNLVRHLWLNQYPGDLWPELWLNATSPLSNIASIVVYRSFSGSETLDVSALQYESDKGHIRLALGTFAPQGSTAVITYSGGYATVPDDLKQLAIFKATEMALLDLDPEARADHGVDLSEIRQYIADGLAPYMR